MKRKLAMYAGLMGLAVVAQGAAITWKTPTTVTHVSHISTTGTLSYAGNFGGNAETVNVSGEDILFQDMNDYVDNGSTTVGFDAYIRYSDGEATAGTFFVGNTGSTAFNNVLDSIEYENTSSLRLFLQNLTEGQQYQVQIFVSDDRTSGTPDNNTRTQLWSDAWPVADGSQSDAAARGDSTSLIGTFTADASGIQAIYDDGINNNQTIINGFVLRAVPEPATLGLITAFGGSILFVRRFMQM